MELFFILTLCLILGAATAYFANQRGRDPLIWFMVGMLLGIFGLFLLFLLPPVEISETDREEEVETIEEKRTPRPIRHDYLIKDWFYYDKNRERQGPIRFEKLRELWKNADINEESFVWSEGMPEWQKVEEVRGLHTHLQLGS